MNDPRRQRPQPADPSVKEVPLSLLKESDRLRQPPYPRIEELAAHIKENGQTTPLFVRPLSAGFYELISGYRRLTALRKINFDRALVRVFSLDDKEAYDLALSENQDRDSLTQLELAHVCLNLQRDCLTVEQIARKMGWSASSNVHRYLRVAKQAPAALRAALQARKASLSIACAFLDHCLNLPEQQQEALLEHAASKKLSAAEFGRHVKRLTGGPKAKPEIEPISGIGKDGAFKLSALRFDATSVERLDAQIEILRTALKRARTLRRKAATAEETRE